jgi:hypothetical protein
MYPECTKSDVQVKVKHSHTNKTKCYQLETDGKIEEKDDAHFVFLIFSPSKHVCGGTSSPPSLERLTILPNFYYSICGSWKDIVQLYPLSK